MGEEAGDWLDGWDHQRIYRIMVTPSDPQFGNSLGRMNQEERQEEVAKDNGQVLCKQGSSDSWHQGHLGVDPRIPTCACILSHFSRVQLFATPWTVAHQAPLSLGFPWQEYWTGLPFPSPGNLPDPGI